MTFDGGDETAPTWGGEGYGNIFAYNVSSNSGDSNIWAMNVEDLQTWPVREGSSNDLVQDFHPYDSIRGSSPNMPGNGSNNRQPEFIFMKNGQLYFSTIGWQNDYDCIKGRAVGSGCFWERTMSASRRQPGGFGSHFEALVAAFLRFFGRP